MNKIIYKPCTVFKDFVKGKTKRQYIRIISDIKNEVVTIAVSGATFVVPATMEQEKDFAIKVFVRPELLAPERCHTVTMIFTGEDGCVVFQDDAEIAN